MGGIGFLALAFVLEDLVFLLDDEAVSARVKRDDSED